MFDPKVWAAVPFHFWSAVFFVFGCTVGSFLNVCIYRMPLGKSLMWPPSHCPHCTYSIPWYLNVPLITWLALRGRCANCKAPISPRYFIVELITGLAFLAAWLKVGHASVGIAIVYCLILSGFIVATFIDLEHFIIPDEITLGGAGAGFVCSFLVPALHKETQPVHALVQSVLGIAVGAGIVYFVLRLGKLLFGKQQIELHPNARVIFTETALVLPDQQIPFEDIFYRKSDTIFCEAKTVELVDRCYPAAKIRLSPEKLRINEDTLNPEDIRHMEIVTDKMVLPREAMGLGDVKFMAAIGAFLGWQAAIFSLLISSVLGALAGLLLILLRKHELSSRIPYGPYIAAAAVIWMFSGRELLAWWWRFLEGRAAAL